MFNRRPEAYKASAGFSLVELLTVLAILAAAFSLVVAHFGRSASVASLRATAFELAARVRATRAMAIAANHDVTFVIDPKTRAYGAASRPAVALPREVSVFFEANQDILRGPANNHLTFYPSGSSSGGRIVLSRANDRVSVTVDWLTGAVAVENLP
ncbi:MAG: GspH/FimT family pseudopilin [Hyphomicrobiaceae bacterium]|nr:GspH/FimT family pseudopilin [Hyphomicrobiaceae bacterium]